jgi:hypothetical protein
VGNGAVVSVSLAYVRGTNRSCLFLPGDGFLDAFEKRHGFAMVWQGDPKKIQAMGAGLFWMVAFHHAVIRDKVDPQSLHKTLMQIAEFRNHCAYDIPFMDKYENL